MSDYPRSKVLFRGQRTSKGHHECSYCQRPIGPQEVYWVRVLLMVEGPQCREVFSMKACCRPV